MSRNYKFHNPVGVYFVSSAVVEWIDVFTPAPARLYRVGSRKRRNYWLNRLVCHTMQSCGSGGIYATFYSGSPLLAGVLTGAVGVAFGWEPGKQLLALIANEIKK